MYQGKVKVLYNRQVADNYYKLSFEIPGAMGSICAGQFLEIRVANGTDPLLRRPFGFHRITKKGKAKIVEVLYEVVGKGTEILAHKGPGEFMDVIGPLGNGFEYKDSAASNQQAIIVAGGIGVAPLMMLAEELKGLKAIVLLGANSKNRVLCEREFKKIGCGVKVATDDGSKGHKGFVTDLLRTLPTTNDQRLTTINDQRPATIYACGPNPMLKAVSQIAIKNNIKCQVLLEEYMACGLGVCMGCAIMTKTGYKMVCKDGPVLNAEEIQWG